MSEFVDWDDEAELWRVVCPDCGEELTTESSSSAVEVGLRGCGGHA